MKKILILLFPVLLAIASGARAVSYTNLYTYGFNATTSSATTINLSVTAGFNCPCVWTIQAQTDAFRYWTYRKTSVTAGTIPATRGFYMSATATPYADGPYTNGTMLAILSVTQTGYFELTIGQVK